MGLIFESAAYQHDPQSTATHVLLVGCGAYPNLAAAGYGALQPLTSPKLSVKALADWFLSGIDGMPAGQELPPEQAFYNPEAPLGSLAMLTSPSDSYVTPSGIDVPCTRPTLLNIRDEYIRWIDRLGDNPDSRGVFLFCGHGISDGLSQFLVADNFGEDPHDPYSAVFHASNTFQATIRKTAATLYFWIDACMELSEDLIVEIGEPRPLIPGKRVGPAKTTEWSVLRATTTNRLAYAPVGNASTFLTGLLQALRGHCGTQRYGNPNYGVGASELRQATAAFMKLAQGSISPNERQKLGDGGGEGDLDISLHFQTKRPLVLVEMDVYPMGYRPIARAFMENASAVREQKRLAAGPVQFIKEQGEWTYGASADNNEFQEQVLERQLLKDAVHSWRCLVP